MGFRTYNPGLNRFTSRDMYIGALADLNLGTNPWNTNRYTFGGGNPVSRIELDGHVNECLSCGGGGGDASVLAAIQSDGQTTAEPEPEPAPDKPGLFGRAVSRVSKVAETVKDYQGGIGAHAWDTVKGVGQLQSANIDCLVSGDCRQQTAMVTTLVTNPTTVVTATIDPVRNDWKEGNHARAAGRVAFMLGEAIAAKGLSKLGTATTSTARAGTAAGDGISVFRTPRTGSAGDELGSGLNPANHALGDRSAYVGSENVVRDFANPKVGGYENGYVRYNMHRDFESEFSGFRFRYDGGGADRWEYQIPQGMIARFNELTISRTWVPW